MSSESGDKHWTGTPEERVKAWLEMSKNENGQLKQGVRHPSHSQEFYKGAITSLCAKASIYANVQTLGLDEQPHASPPSSLPRRHWPSPIRHL